MRYKIENLVDTANENVTLVDLEISGNPRSLALVRKILCTCSDSLAVPAKVINDVKLAVTEACTNIIKHAFNYDASKKFGLNIEVNKQFFLIKVIYEDCNFDPEAISEPDLNNIREGGLGVFIMRNIMDDVVYSVEEGTGFVTLRMLKMILESHDLDITSQDSNPEQGAPDTPPPGGSREN